MSGGGKIIEKRSMSLPESGDDVVRYHLVDGQSWDETFVYALPADDEPPLGATIWWGSGQCIYWGQNDEKCLSKVGFSWKAQ